MHFAALTPLIIFTILAALTFDFLNGFNDAANSIATIVSTRVLKPQHAVLWAAFFNFIAFLFFGLHVAETIGTGLINPSIVNVQVILAALLGATGWNIFCWYFGLPSSSSHALIGGLLGAAIAKAGYSSIKISGISKVLAAIIISPTCGFLIGGLLMLLVARIFFRVTPLRVDGIFRKVQLLSSAAISIAHGSNDAQKTMGIIAILLFSCGALKGHFYIPIWIIVACNLVIALGTLSGGWRIVKTMGMKITRLKPVGGFCAETAGAATLMLATHLGIPVSTTHTITGSIVGVGSSLQSVRAVRWGVARRIVWAWLLTIPAAGSVAFGLGKLIGS